METQAQIVTIIIHSDIDPSQLLEIANDAAEQIIDDIESYGEEAHYLEEETSVEYADQNEDNIVGGRQHE